ncbi:aminotransferase class I/II-fold pyridoxal phosphate-dependent enzyme [Candidatus Bathyarchaeota archaeon]|nr:aminotransferase class I/II-fold pyridoxal phosphate-dependent enzyme [Candidatus Bathyarchaeota archaeon]
MAFEQDARKNFPEWPQLDEDDYAAVKSVLDSGNLWCGAPAVHKGENVWAFLEEFAEFCGAKHCIAVTNGTHAIEVALMALGVGLGDEVIVSDYTFVASGSAVVGVNAVPIFCDIRPDTFNMDESLIESLITDRTKAIVPVHLGGMPCDMERIMEIAREHDLAVVEDCAHSHGSRYKGKHLGNFGDCGTFSFQASKVLTAGEGGAIMCNDDDLAEKIYSVSDCGRKKGEYFYDHFRYGSNYRLGEFQAALLRSQLRKLKEWQNGLRNANADKLRTMLDEIDGITCQSKLLGTESVGQYVFPFKFDPAVSPVSKALFYEKLNDAGIPTDDCYPPLHGLQCFKEMRGLKGIDYSKANWGGKKSDDVNFPVVTSIFNHSVEFPQELLLVRDEEDLAYIAKVVAGIMAGK